MSTPPQPPPEWAYHLDEPAPEPGRPYTLGELMPDPAPAPAPPGRPVDRTAALMILGAGLGIVLASFLPWATITAPIVGSMSVSGTDGGDGWITAAVGAAVAGYGAMILRRRLPAVLGWFAALGGLGVAGLAVWDIIDLRSRVADLKAEMVADGDEFGFAERMAEAVHAQIGVGLWLLIGAGLTAVVAIGWTLLRRRAG